MIINFMAYARKVPIKKQKLKIMQRFLHQSLEHIQLSFKVVQSGGILFLMCTKKTASNKVTKDKEQQVKA